ncbi:MAG: hypothetical protein RL711_1941 [Bacteroidota bacterium]|jgi:hypothetical protein
MFEKLTLDQLNYANIVLMLVAVVAAIILPFEVFLFAYGILGPLHYLTEISWLHDKNYYAKFKNDFIPFLVLALGIFLVSYVFTTKVRWISSFVFLAVALALVMIYIEKWLYRIIFLMFSAFLLILFYEFELFRILFMVYMPTIIHVYIFTGLFIWYGALKSKSTSGYVSLLAYVVCTFLVVFMPFESESVSNFAVQNFQLFLNLNFTILSNIGHEELANVDGVYQSGVGIMVMRFIAFAYTYHYLNWFSKTSVIKWHEVPKLRLLVVVFAWCSAMAIYIYDYSLGFMVMYLLSFLHVLLEFPLNHKTIIGIVKEIKAR